MFLKCAHSKQSRRVSLQFAFFILPFVRHTKLLRWLRTLKRKEKFNFLSNPLAGTSGPDDTQHVLRVIKYGISDLLHLEATRIGPGLLENWLHAAAILLEELLGMLFRLNAFLCVCLGTAGWHSAANMCPQLAVSLGKWSKKTNPCVHGKSGITSELKQPPSITLTKKTILIWLCYIVYKGIQIHQVPFWLYLSFQWVNNSCSSRKLSYEYYRWYTWGYLAVSRKQTNSFGGEMRRIHHGVLCCLINHFMGVQQNCSCTFFIPRY